MSQADSTNAAVSTRRRFLSTAAAVAAGGTALALASVAATVDAAASVDAVAPSDVDPILQLIDRHKAANAELNAAYAHLSDMEEIIPTELAKGTSYCFEVQIVETDDPRWTAANIRYNDCVIKTDAVAIEMLNVKPTTLAGLQAMLEYAAEHVAQGNLWPDGAQIEDDDEDPEGKVLAFRARDWSFYLMRNLGEAVQTIAA